MSCVASGRPLRAALEISVGQSFSTSQVVLVGHSVLVLALCDFVLADRPRADEVVAFAVHLRPRGGTLSTSGVFPSLYIFPCRP